jgi:hypothetical protein
MHGARSRKSASDHQRAWLRDFATKSRTALVRQFERHEPRQYSRRINLADDRLRYCSGRRHAAATPAYTMRSRRSDRYVDLFQASIRSIGIAPFFKLVF